MRRRSEAAAFGRRVGHATIYKAAAVFTLGVLAAIGALVANNLLLRRSRRESREEETPLEDALPEAA